MLGSPLNMRNVVYEVYRSSGSSIELYIITLTLNLWVSSWTNVNSQDKLQILLTKVKLVEKIENCLI